jgi:hypothetical protein
VRRDAAMNREVISKVTRTIEEAKEAIEQGFQFVTDVENVKLWQKRK